MGGRYLNQNGQPKKSRKPLIITLIVLGVLLVLVLLAIWLVPKISKNFLSNNVFDKVNTVTLPTDSGQTQESSEPSGTADTGDALDSSDPSESSDPTSEIETWPTIVSDQNVTNIMIVGQNYREGEEHWLSDTMIICSINRQTKTLTMTSVLRDLYVPLPAYAGHGQGRNRINVCYHLGTYWTGSVAGGMEMLALCIEKNFGIPIHHTVEFSFESFEKIIDMMGGVELDITEAESAYFAKYIPYMGQVDPGIQTLNGYQALQYARLRKIDNDFGRTNRQRTLINSLISKAKTMGLMEVYDMVMEILPMITTDMTPEQMSDYVFEFLPMLFDLNIVSQTLPLDSSVVPESYWYKEVEGVGYVIECNVWANKKYLQEQLGFSDE